MFAWKLMTLGFVAVALVFLSAGGCASNPVYSGFGDNSAVAAVNKADRTLVVVPVKGQPIMVLKNTVPTWAFAVALLPAAVAANAEMSAATKSNEAICARLNQNTDIYAERFLAEECVKLLKASPKSAFHSVAVHPNDAKMPWAQELELSEQQRFKVNLTNTGTWTGIFLDWEKRPAVVGGNPTTGERVVYLEVTAVYSIINDSKSLGVHMGLRMIDAATGQTLRIVGTGNGGPITPVTIDSDLNVFSTDLRKFMTITAERALRDMGLI